MHEQEQRTCMSTVPASDMFSIGDDEQNQPTCMSAAPASDMFSLSSDEMEEQEPPVNKKGPFPPLN
jgi:hypothetical protein